MTKTLFAALTLYTTALAQDVIPSAPQPPKAGETHEVTLPTAEELGDFVSNVKSVSVGLADATGLKSLAKWVDTSSWEGLAGATFTGYALVGSVTLESELATDAFMTMGIFKEGDKQSHIAFWGNEFNGDIFDYA